MTRLKAETDVITAKVEKIWQRGLQAPVATDLQCIWGLFEDASARRYLLESYAPDQATLERAQAWGVLMAIMLVDTGRVDSPRHERQGRLQLQRLQADI